MVKDFSDIMAEVRKDDVGKHDKLVKIDELLVDGEGLINVVCSDDRQVANSMKITDWASSQLCGWMGMPFKYYRKCPNKLKAANANYWLDNVGSSPIRVRCKDNTIRGILSESYTPISNSEVITSVKNSLQKQEINVEDFSLSDYNFHLRATFPMSEIAAGETLDGKKDLLRGGIHVMNSEVGSSAVRVISIVYRMVCTNGLISAVGEKTFEQRHIHITVHDLQAKTDEAIIKAIEDSKVSTLAFAKLKEQAIDNPKEEIERLSEHKFSNKFANRVAEAFDEEPENNRFGLINAFTRAARELNYDARLDVEKFAGSLVR